MRRWLIPIAVAGSLLVAAPAAWGHAQLLGTVPQTGTTVKTQPAEVIFQFNQDVGGSAGAVRVYNAQGQEVDNTDVTHPNGNEHWMGVGLKAHLPDGTYTATYRVISADTHIVYGGLVFNLGHAGKAPKFTVAGLINRNESGEVTKLAVGVVRFLDYLTIALVLGGLLFLLAVSSPALASEAGPEPRWAQAADALARRMNAILSGAALLGLLVSVLGVLLQGASAAGLSLWSSLKGSIVEGTLESRFGWVWGGRAIDWLVISLVLLLTRRSWLRRPPAALLGLLAAGCVYLAMTPALAGHASIESPRGVFFPSDFLHVLAAAIWVGGIASLLVALPLATGLLEPAERSRLLLAALRRFSPLALASVLVIAVTGVVQAYIDVRSIHGLLHTTYGALIIVKTLLLIALIAFGWVNRERIIPGLEKVVAAGSTPGGIGLLARRSLRGEGLVMLAVLGVTAALISYAPPIDAASGPFSTSTRLGPALLEMTLEPARVGPNVVHLYLIDARTGAQYTATKELTVQARLPSKGIGPLKLQVNAAGPGHYVLDSAVLSPGGTWSIEFVDRISEFEEFTRVVKVPIS